MHEALEREASTLTEMLLARCQNNDADAEVRLFRRLRQALTAAVEQHVCFRSIAQWESSADVTSAVWVRLFERRLFERFSDCGPGSLRAFLFCVLDGLMVDLYRHYEAVKRGSGRVRLFSDGASVDRAGRGSGPLTLVSISEILEQCAGFLQGDERQVWELRTLEGWSSPMIARHMGIADSTARGMLRRALLRLQGSGLTDGFVP